MKKIIIFLTIFITILSINKQQTTEIPNDSIRFRVIANSNSKEDQNLKKQIVKNLSKELVKTNQATNIEETRKYIKKNLPTFENIINQTIKENNSSETFFIKYGQNYFPEKKYKEKVYPKGEYESLVVELGNKTGKNFWCVLFPPLCFADEKTEYKSFIKEFLEKNFF